MARYRGPVCRLCRREGVKLFLKGARCYTEKCAIERRNYQPGQHGQSRRTRMTEYGTQLREKQKLKRIYGLTERQFRGSFLRATRQQGITGDNLLRLLEQRLDNVVYRLGLTSARQEARQLIQHGHVLVNGRTVDIPSCLVAEGDVVEVKPRSRGMVSVQQALATVEMRGVPTWLALEREQFRGTVRSLPTREEIGLPMTEQLVVEFYAR